MEVLVNNWISRYGVPLELHSDQSQNFESAKFKGLCELMGSSKTITVRPKSDGMVDRCSATLETNLRLFVNDHQTDWDWHILLFLLAFRTATHENTGRTLASVLYGRWLRLPADFLFGRPVEYPVSLYLFKCKL